MKKKKEMIKRIAAVILLVITLLCVLCMPCFAHSGRTDSRGGHRVSATGDYHYHCGGHPAHQHENGVCPYKQREEISDRIFRILSIIIIGPVSLVMIIYFISSLIGKIASRFKRENRTDTSEAAEIFAPSKTIEELESEIEELENKKADIIWALKNKHSPADLDELRKEKEIIIEKIKELEKELTFKSDTDSE